MTEISL